jgi:hypothetical protein
MLNDTVIIGSSWSSIRPPSTDSEGNAIKCNAADTTECALHLHSVTTPHNFGRIFSSPAPGFVMGVGSVGTHLAPYEESDTFLSTDAGVSWQMIRRDAHKYEFGDQGSVLVVVNDEEGVDFVSYSIDYGKNWYVVLRPSCRRSDFEGHCEIRQRYSFGVKLSAKALLTIPDSTSQKFLLLGQTSRRDQNGDGRFVVVFLDFAPTRQRQCTDDDFERWNARTAKGKECLMGHRVNTVSFMKVGLSWC